MCLRGSMVTHDRITSIWYEFTITPVVGTTKTRSERFLWLCTGMNGGDFQPEFRADNVKPASNPTENGERVRNLLRDREILTDFSSQNLRRALRFYGRI